jgi:flagellar motor switch/type III secretory pathway protein FliN
VPPRSPNFSPFPFDCLPRRSRREAALESALARWLARRSAPSGTRLAALAGGAVRARLIGIVPLAPDPHAAIADVRWGGASIALIGSSRPVRALAQRLLGGPAELEAPRPLTVVEQAIWALAVAAAAADLGVDAEVWPLEGEPPADAVAVAFAVGLPAELGSAMTVTACVPPDLPVRNPPPRPPHAWRFDLPIVVGRCSLPAASVARLAVRDVITVESCLELALGAGKIGLTAAPGAVEARVATGYVPRDMAHVASACLEVTVQLGTIQLSLRELGELAIGEILPLGRPLSGPYEIYAAGRVVGQGELVDIDGELGVRIVSLADESFEQE